MTLEERLVDRIWETIDAEMAKERTEQAQFQAASRVLLSRIADYLASAVVHQFDESLSLTEPSLHARMRWKARYSLVRLIARRATPPPPGPDGVTRRTPDPARPR